MDIKKKIVALFACFALCASFVPVLAIADLTDDEALDAENDIELTAQASGIHVAINKSTGGPDGSGKFTFANGSAVVTYNGTPFAGREVSTAETSGVVSITPTPEDGYAAIVTIDGNRVPVAAGTAYAYTVPDTVADNGVVNIDVDFEKSGGNSAPSETRQVKMTLDQASLPMLAEKCTLTIGFSQGDRVEFNPQGNGGTYEVSTKTLERTLLTFTIDTKYFIPTAIVNGKTFETFDEGTTQGDSSRVNIVVELEGEDAAADEFNVNLSIGARANVDLQSQSVGEASASYMLVEDGRALVSDVAGTEIDLAIADTSIDTAVTGAVATFDLGVQENGATVATTETPLDIDMQLDTSVYTASDYVVVRNHEGTITELDTAYDASTGWLSFSSDQFSEYSLVDKNASSSAAKPTSKTTLAKTGDPLTAGGIVVVSLAALGAVVLATRKLRA